jgi:hypothetical protein
MWCSFNGIKYEASLLECNDWSLVWWHQCINLHTSLLWILMLHCGTPTLNLIIDIMLCIREHIHFMFILISVQLKNKGDNLPSLQINMAIIRNVQTYISILKLCPKLKLHLTICILNYSMQLVKKQVWQPTCRKGMVITDVHLLVDLFIFVCMYTSHLFLCTSAIKSSLVLHLISVYCSCLFVGSRSCSISYLSGLSCSNWFCSLSNNTREKAVFSTCLWSV